LSSSQRLEGPSVEGIEEVKVDIAIGDEPERVYQEMGPFIINPADTSSDHGYRFIKALVSQGVSPASKTKSGLQSVGCSIAEKSCRYISANSSYSNS
jgi:hypothetical protein